MKDNKPIENKSKIKTNNLVCTLNLDTAMTQILEKKTTGYVVKLKDLEEEYMDCDSLINKENIQYIMINEKDFEIQIWGNFLKIKRVIK